MRLALVVVPTASSLAGFGAGDVASGDGLLSWNKVAEVLSCLHAYGRLPAGLSEEDVAAASAHGARRWTLLMRHRRIAQLAMGKMVAKIVDSAVARANGSSNRCLQLFSARESCSFQTDNLEL